MRPDRRHLPHQAARIACALLALLGLASTLQDAAAAEKLVMGRLNENSLVYDINERKVAEVFRRAGIELEMRRLPSLRSLELANSGEIDGDLHRIAEVLEQYPNLMLVPTPIEKLEIAVWSGSPQIASKSRADILKMTVVYPRGRLMLQKITKGMAASETPTRAAAAEMAMNGRVDLLIGIYTDGQADIVAGRVTGLHVWPHVFGADNLYLVLNRRHAALVPRIDAAIRQMKQDGLLDRYHLEGLRGAGVHPLDP